ncbi:MAG TPA: hypothetical protein VJQ54_13260, partial [Candidatus Sulfotelmatobacter sp.]|nr:hypothetical protein [Candidatus Sulfotelmatobacter sp.]
MKLLVFLAAMVLSSGTAVAETSPQQMLNAGQVDDAIRALTAQVRKSPGDAAAHNFLCRAYFMIED